MNNPIDRMMERAKTIWAATQVVIDSLKDTERKSIKQIAETAGLAINLEPAKILPYVNDFLHNTEAGYVSPGKFGGFIKGQRPVKIVKVKAPQASSTIELGKEDVTSEDVSNENFTTL